MKRSTIFIIILFAISVIVAGASWFARKNKDQGNDPVISMDGDSIEVSVTADDAAILEGIIANDAEDGDLSDKLIVESMSRFISYGKRRAKIAVVDSSNNVVEVTRNIIYTDYESPKFELTAPLIFPVGTDKLDGIITATDVIDGDISGKIRMKNSTSDLGDREGSFEVSFTCSNSLGDSSEIPLTITYDNSAADNDSPKIALTDYLVYVKAGAGFDLWSMVETLTADRKTYEKTSEDGRSVLRVPGTEPAYNEDGADPNAVEAENFEILTGGLDFNTPGVYEVFFNYKDSQNRTGKTCLVVVVEEAQ